MSSIPDSPVLGLNPSGLCMCGCGQPAPLARQSDTKRGFIRGLPLRYVKGHQWDYTHTPTMCATCGQAFYRSPSRRALYCSHECAISAHRQDTNLRFWVKVDQTGGLAACWPWTGCKDRHGYGLFAIGGHMWHHIYAHRFALETVVGDLGPDLYACHHCDNPPCCNPAHLFAGTLADNSADCKAKGRTAHGERQGSSRLTEVQVVEIRQRLAAGERQSDLARLYAVSSSTIWSIAHGKHWTHLQAG